jgi:hypothetical protein
MFPHLPESIRRTLRALRQGLVPILGDRLVGLYFGGSLANGDFCDSSDLDFLVVTRGELNMEDALALGLLHRDLLNGYPDAARLEGDYTPLEFLVPEGTTEPVPGCERGVFLPKVGEIMLSADNISDMRENGMTVYGPDPREILPVVGPEQIRAAVREMLDEGPGAADTPVEAAAAVLNLVRSACSMQTGLPVTKPGGARWGLANLASEWHPLIRAASAIRCGQASQADTELVTELLPRFDRYIRKLTLN